MRVVGLSQERIRKKRKTTSKVDRDRLINAYENDEDIEAVIKALGLKNDTAKRIIKRYIKTGERYAKKRGGKRTGKVTPEMAQKLEQLVEMYKDWTLQQYSDELTEKYGFPSVHYTTIGRHLHCMCYTVKKMDIDPAARNSLEVKLERKAFCEWFLVHYHEYNLVWVGKTDIICNIWTLF